MIEKMIDKTTMETSMPGHEQSQFPKAEDLLRNAGLKVTATRVALLQLIGARAQHMSADEITDALHKDGTPVDRVTIYRNLERMLREGLLLADLQPGRALRVALNTKPGKVHHHHIVCDVCGKVTATESCYLKQNWQLVSEDIRRTTGYELSGHLMQYTGTCPSCSENGD